MTARATSVALTIFVMVPAMQVRAAENAPAAAARERQNAVKTLSVRFKNTEVIAPGGVTFEAGPFATSKNPIPAVETKLESENRLVLAEPRKVRFEDNHPSWMLTNGKLLERSCLSATDGTDGLILYPTGVGAEGTPKGVIENSVRVSHFRTPVLAPLALAFRALDSMMGDEDIEGWKPTGAKAPIGGAMCEEYENPGSRRTVRRFWIDPARGHVVRRIQITRDGKLGDQCDIDYRPHEVTGWIPSGWRWSYYKPNGSLYKSVKVEVLEATINEAQEPAQFKLEFPAGASVTNNKNNKDYRVKEDGTLLELDARGQETGVTVLPPGAAWYRRHFWLLVGLGLAGVLILGFASWQWRRRGQVRSAP